MSKLKVAMIAPPWLKIPPANYGGAEFVIDNLCRGLMESGAEVELFTVKGTTTPASRYHWYYDEDQYNHIHKPLYDSGVIPMTHVLRALDIIKRAGDFDIIHDHNYYVGPAIMRDLGPEYPPVLHTLHGPLDDPSIVENRSFYSELARAKSLYFNGISNAQLRGAPFMLRNRLVGAIHHGIDPTHHKFYSQKEDYFVNVGRIARDKGLALGARLCNELGARFKMAGVVAGIADAKHLAAEVANPSSQYKSFEDFNYYKREVLPQMESGKIEFVGGVIGEAKDEIIGRAKAFLFPIDWEEPFGVAVIDALVCGTPVVAMRRGSLPEIIEHGVNGFLADNEEEFKYYMTQVDKIDPAACRKSVEDRFTYKIMANNYIAAYETIVTEVQPAFVPLPSRQFAFYEKLDSSLRGVQQDDAAI
jgi:glycosyltransferase involved in cell wall biosynthesis